MAKLPEFKTDEDAADFFDTHSTVDFWDDLEPVEDVTISIPHLPRSLVTLPLSEKLLEEIKQLAREEGIPYQRLVRQWLAERVRQERRAAS